MKKLSMFAVAALTVANVASAVFDPSWERPIMEGQLTYIVPTKPVRGFKALHLVLNQRDGANEPTSFTLTEDTGIRCVTAPCPSTKETMFEITGVHATRTGVIYEATEVLTNIPPHVRIARRGMRVTEVHGRRTSWNVEVMPFSAPTDRYFAYPTEVNTIQFHP